MEFKKNNSLSERINKFTNLKKKYPNIVPIIIDNYNTDRNNELTKNKFLISKNERFYVLIMIVRKYLNLENQKSKALFFYINNKLINQNELINNIYEKYKDEDGFLYITYAYENTFGGRENF